MGRTTFAKPDGAAGWILNFENAAQTCLIVFVIRKLIFRTVGGVVLLVALVVVAAYFYPEKFLCMDSGKASADAIIVLGGGPHEQRAERAAELFKANVASRLIVSGAGDDEIHRQILLQAGVPAGAIQIENKSQTTRENAEFTIKLLRAEKIRSAILVTSWYHSRRALKTFEHYAPEIQFYSRPSYFAFDREDWTRVVTKRIYLEYLKLPGYWIRYGICPF
jgi:uncharacterized SAM-binding protein YcdF (DUF218 family)